MKGIAGTLLFALFLSASLNTGASTITAASCSAGDVSTALNSASSGDTVNIPSGTCHWSTQVAWTAPSNVILHGAGSTSVLGGGDATVIVDDYTTNNDLFKVIVPSSGTFRMYGITFQGGTGVLKDHGVVSLNGSSTQFRFDHIHINMQSYSTLTASKWMYFSGPLNGVVDHIVVDLAKQGFVEFDGDDPNTNGDQRMAEATGFGGSNFIFLEDNTFNAHKDSSGLYLGTVTDCRLGGKFVLRYNTVVGAGFGQTHPTGGAGRGRGCRAHEIYGNTAIPSGDFNPQTDNPPYTFSWMSSGTSLVWGNTANGVYKNFIYMDSMRKNNATYPESAPPNGWGYCGTEFNGTGSNWDGNTNTATGYPCLDQPGRGQGDRLSGQFPNAVNTTTGTIAWPHQALEPIYEWGNTFTAVAGWGNNSNVRISSGAPTRLVGNQDWYMYTASFNGTSGVGTGTLATRPSTCTPKVAYWATDARTLYQCSLPNTWTTYYTPYTYPHPLTQTGLAAPTNLHISGL